MRNPLVIIVLCALGCGCDTSSAPVPVAQPPSPTAQIDSPTLDDDEYDTAVIEADSVVIGRVSASTSAFGQNDDGDVFIYTDLTVDVEETLKGPSFTRATMRLLGGRVGDDTYVTSEFDVIPTVGERAIFSTSQADSGPRRAKGFGVHLIQGDQLRGRGVSLSAWRERVKTLGGRGRGRG